MRLCQRLRAALLLLLTIFPAAGCDFAEIWDEGPADHLEEQAGSWTLERFERTDYRDGAVTRTLVVEDAGTFDLRIGSTIGLGEAVDAHTFNDFVYDVVPAVESAFLLYLSRTTFVNPNRGRVLWHTDDDARERLYVWNLQLAESRYVILTIEQHGGDAQTWHFIQTARVDGHAVRAEEAYHVRRR